MTFSRVVTQFQRNHICKKIWIEYPLKQGYKKFEIYFFYKCVLRILYVL